MAGWATKRAMPDQPEPMVGAPLLAADEPPPFEIDRPDSQSRFFITCDHASNRMPRALGSLGLQDEQLKMHVAWDPGALLIAERLAERLDATLIRSNYSRLVVDLNRALSNPASMPEQSEVVQVPGNKGLSGQDRRRRAEALYYPYHRALARLLDERIAAGSTPLYVAVHTFTPVYFGEARHVEVCVSWRRDDRLGRLVCPRLETLKKWKVVAHDPFVITADGDYGIPWQAEARGLPNVMIEVRQDLLEDDDEARAWGDRLADALLPVEHDPSIANRIDPPPDLDAAALGIWSTLAPTPA